jgi:hypothetical protein
VNAAPETPNGIETHIVRIDLRASNEADDLHRLVTGSFILADPGGARHSARWFYDTPEQPQGDLQVDARATEDGSLVFEMEEPVTTVTGWSLIVQNDREVGITVPLDGTRRSDPTSYPIALAIPPSATAALANEAEVPQREDCQVRFEITPRRASVAVDLSTWTYRAAPGTRVVKVDLDIRNTSEPASICSGLAYTNDVPLRLAVDGTAIEPSSRGDTSSALGADETFTLPVVYEVPVTASHLALLVGTDDLNQIDLGSVSLLTFATE